MQVSSLTPVDQRIVRKAVRKTMGPNWFLPGISKSDKPLRDAVRGNLQQTIRDNFGLRQSFRPSPAAISHAYSQLTFTKESEDPVFKTLDDAIDSGVTNISASGEERIGVSLDTEGNLNWLTSGQLIRSLETYQTRVRETAAKRREQSWSVLPYQLEKRLGKDFVGGVNGVRIYSAVIIAGLCLSVAPIGLEILGGAFILKSLHMLIRNNQANYGDRLAQRIKTTRQRVISETPED
jgi:hypothetical protein